MDRTRFAELVAEALDSLPEQFARRLQNVEVVVEDEPTVELLRSLDLDPSRDTLFGLYQGIPLGQRGVGYAMALPDKITIFYRPLVRSYHAPEAIRREIVRTVIHEIGHFFGLSDHEMNDAGR